MKIFLDTEFIEDGRTINLISIGMVKENGDTFYREIHPDQVPWNLANPWVLDNVYPHTSYGGFVIPKSTASCRSHAELANEVVQFAGPNPEFWAYFAAYDWVVLCQLYGTMMDLPKSWPMYCRDFKQYMDERGLKAKEYPQIGIEHNALQDALWLQRAYRWANTKILDG